MTTEDRTTVNPPTLQDTQPTGAADMQDPNGKTSTEQIEELRALLEQLDTRDLAFVVAYVTDLATGRLVPDGAGSVRVARRLEPLSEDQTPYAGLFNSILGLGPRGDE